MIRCVGEPTLGRVGDLSALIFVALAVAWAAYLIPKALRHHAEAEGSRSVDDFSGRVRVLASREPINRKQARLVPAGSGTPSAPTVAELRARRARARQAAQRRRRVLMLLVLTLAVVGGLAGYRLFHWGYVGIPVGLLVAWLVACRLMVRREHAALPVTKRTGEAAAAARQSIPAEAGGEVELATDETGEIPAVSAEVADANPPAVAGAGDRTLWDPVPVTLPTYVNKPQAARRTIRTIELDSTGVWTSGRTERDAAIARQADAAAKEAKESSAADDREQGEGQRAVGS